MVERWENVRIAFGKPQREERDSMADGKETMQIAFGKLFWEGALQHGGGASLGRRLQRGGWKDTERKPCK